MDLVGKQIGNYVAQRELGRGGMGVVYLAQHPIIKKQVAVKVLHEELAIDEQMVQRLWLEAKAAGEIDSEHIVEVLDFGRLPLGMAGGVEPRQTVYLAMELLLGQSVSERFFQAGMSIRDSVDVVRQVCRALEASHQKGIVHRDLKPENIFLIERNGRTNFVKVLDFGIAKLVSNPFSRTRTGVLLGTPAYMSPEQCRGSGAVEHRSDIYSLGVVLYELVTGTVPFAAKGFGDVLVSQMTAAPVPPSVHNPKVPASLEAAILCALQKSPDDRFQSMAAFGAALGSVATELAQASDLHVRATGPRQKTTDRDSPGRTLGGATLVDPPDAAMADAIAVPSVHDRETQALANPQLHVMPTQPKGEAVHHRSTLIQGSGLHASTTLLKQPAGEAAAAGEPSPATQAAAAAQPAPAASAKSELKQRVAGASLREVLGSTGAVKALQKALDDRGAPQPIKVNLTPATPTPILDDTEFLAEQRRRAQLRMMIVGGVLLVAALAILLVVR